MLNSFTVNLVIACLFALLIVHVLTFLYQRFNPKDRSIKRLIILGTCLGAYSASSAASIFSGYISP